MLRWDSPAAPGSAHKQHHRPGRRMRKPGRKVPAVLGRAAGLTGPPAPRHWQDRRLPQVGRPRRHGHPSRQRSTLARVSRGCRAPVPVPGHPHPHPLSPDLKLPSRSNAEGTGGEELVAPGAATRHRRGRTQRGAATPGGRPYPQPPVTSSVGTGRGPAAPGRPQRPGCSPDGREDHSCRPRPGGLGRACRWSRGHRTPACGPRAHARLPG